MKITKSNISQYSIWNKIKKGDISAIENLYHLYSKQLYLYGLKFTHHTQLIEDCIQELFSRLITNYQNLGETDNVKIYLMKAFRNNLFRMMEKEKKYNIGEIDDYHFEILFSAEQEIIEAETNQKKQKVLIEALNNLSPRQKEAVYLRYTRGLEYTEIANIMKVSIEGCRNIIYKAIKSLRKDVDNSDIILLFFFKNKLPSSFL
ncbi:MAG: sigma-70 family RNA polymerase sigma factor [Marinifilum sp.]|jgi:RNA polymerase sigma factor (sigma-70 family)|nr:sigma-70 family RNA polymerase sigma factor [Marinifilum sp.]